MPGPPYRLGATPARRRGPAPARGDDRRRRRPHARRAAPVDRGRTDAPFAGLACASTSGSFWAGPYCTMYLGALGADVIKVESTRRPDGFRFSGAVPEMGDDWYERGGIFAATNLEQARGHARALHRRRGVTSCCGSSKDADVVLENFSARVIEQFDLGYDQLRVVRPELIMVRMPGFGLEGPWRDYVGWAMVIEQATGMASVTGPPDLPMHPGGLADPVIGMHAAVAIQAALEHRARTGEGQLIEIAQLETGANLTAELVIEWSMHETALRRVGNRDPHHAPQGVYPCQGDGGVPGWVAMTISDEAAVAGARGRARSRRLDRRRVARDRRWASRAARPSSTRGSRHGRPCAPATRSSRRSDRAGSPSPRCSRPR